MIWLVSNKSSREVYAGIPGESGTGAWQDSGRDVEVGLTGVMSPPNDTLPMGPDRGFAEMVNYLRWEEELGHKYTLAD